MTRRKLPTKVAREQTPTPFGVILARLLRHSPGVKMAALIDPEGETVDYAGDLPDYFTKLVSAHFRIVLDDVAARSANVLHLARPHLVTVRTGAWTFAVRHLPDGYALVVILRRRAFTLSARALAACDAELAREAGWIPLAASDEAWFALEVEPSRGDRHRPGRVRIEKQWHPVEVLGRVVGRERAYRCRLHTGAEFNLVREPSGQWFSEGRVPQREAGPGRGAPGVSALRTGRVRSRR